MTIRRWLYAAILVSLTACVGGCTKSERIGETTTLSSERPKYTPPKKTDLFGGTCVRSEPGCEQPKQVAILAGGCFWGMEEILRGIPGVLATEVGYTGGGTKSPGYNEVKTGDSGHAESVRVAFNPEKISYEDLLEKWFFRMHDPTTENRQGNDVGTQYRSAIFYLTPEQRRVAEVVKKRVNASGKWESPVVTQIVAASAFTPAEAYHQKYLQKNPNGYTCHYLRD
ncbi:MAG TPA: peptide-methionine (S)-S-oxide reductase MsrA [Polyangiaceae bacterium]|nr:peptide-methionine (S)-S-oxide reductase MsrA [Polyangiaceae bacterium]